MSTITQTWQDNFFEPNNSQNKACKKTWTVVIQQDDIKVTGNTFSYQTPSFKASFTGGSTTGNNYRRTYVYLSQIKLGNYSIKSLCKTSNSTYRIDRWVYANPDDAIFSHDVVRGLQTTGNSQNQFAWIHRRTTVENGEYDAFAHTATVSTSAIFNSNNPDQKKVDITITADVIELDTADSVANKTTFYRAYQNANDYQKVVGSITLNAPPSVSKSQFNINANSFYTGYSTITVSTKPNQSIMAKYGGNIKKVELKVGNKSAVYNTVTNSYSGSLSIDLSQNDNNLSAGTYTPQIIVTDSRGQTTTVNLDSITVKAYPIPTASFNWIERAKKDSQNNQKYILDEEGENALGSFNFNYSNLATGVTPTLTVWDSTGSQVPSTVTWYDSYNDSSGTFGSSYTFPSTVSHPIYAKIWTQNALDITETYNVSFYLTDSNGKSNNTIHQSIQPSFYTIDFLAGGKGIAFGKSASQQGFHCAMNSAFTGSTTVSKLSLNGATTVDSWRNLPTVTTSANGLMTSTDKSKLDRYPNINSTANASTNAYVSAKNNTTVDLISAIKSHIVTRIWRPQSSYSLPAGGTYALPLEPNNLTTGVFLGGYVSLQDGNNSGAVRQQLQVYYHTTGNSIAQLAASTVGKIVVKNPRTSSAIEISTATHVITQTVLVD